MKNILTGLLLLIFLIPQGLFAAADFPEPARAVKKDARNVSIAGNIIESRVYESPDDVKSLNNFYRTSITGDGFAETYNKSQNGIDLSRYNKGDLAFAVAIYNKNNINTISISRYIKQPGLPPPSVANMSWQEYLQLLPEEDVPGRDLDIVPRPPDSVRVGIETMANAAVLTYTTPKQIAEIRSYYREVMPQLGWKEVSAVDFNRMMNRAKNQGMNLSGVNFEGKIAGVEIGDLIKNSQALNFEGPKGRVSVTMVDADPKTPSKKAMVLVNYVEDLKIYGSKDKK